jgi:hypothetical protein
MASRQTAEKVVYSIRCPIHPNVEIGEWHGEIEATDHMAFYCGKCRRLIRFNKGHFKKYLTKGIFKKKVL